jgi:hypothetical protein
VQELALVIDLLDRAEAIAREGREPDLTSEAQRIVRAHPDAEQPVEHVIAALKQELAKPGAAGGLKN